MPRLRRSAWLTTDQKLAVGVKKRLRLMIGSLVVLLELSVIQTARNTADLNLLSKQTRSDRTQVSEIERAHAHAVS